MVKSSTMSNNVFLQVKWPIWMSHSTIAWALEAASCHVSRWGLPLRSLMVFRGHTDWIRASLNRADLAIHEPMVGVVVVDHPWWAQHVEPHLTMKIA
jgi:hypothetical protein